MIFETGTGTGTVLRFTSGTGTVPGTGSESKSSILRQLKTQQQQEIIIRNISAKGENRVGFSLV